MEGEVGISDEVGIPAAATRHTSDKVTAVPAMKPYLNATGLARFAANGRNVKGVSPKL
jgi:hypothetical protein